MNTQSSNPSVRFSMFRAGLVVLVCTITAGHAATIVNWGGNYVSASQVFANTTTATPNSYQNYTSAGQSYATLSGSIQSLTPASGYAAPSGKSSAFSGGFMSSTGTGAAVAGSTSGTVSALSNRAVWDNTGNDRISVSLNGTNAHIRGLITFAKADFLGGTDQQTLGFDSASTFSFSGIMDGSRSVASWLAQDGGVWYISQSTFTQSVYNIVESHNLTNLNSQLWAVYTPTLTNVNGAYLINPAPTTGFSAHTFSDLQAVGVFFDSYGQPITDGGFSRFALQTFSVSAAVIPEPSSCLLLVTGLGLVAVARRRQTSRG